MRIFLTGGTGFVGSHFLNQISLSDYVTALKRNKNSKTKIKLEKEPKWILSSIDKVDNKYLMNNDLLVHLAAHSAQPPYDNLQNCIQKNVIDPLSLFEKAYSSGIRKYLVAGSCFEYGLSANNHKFIPPNAPLFPIDSYPASKAIASIAFTQWAIQKKVSMSFQRIFYVYGDGENPTRFYPLINKAAEQGKDFEMSNGDQIRDISEINYVVKSLYKEAVRMYKSKRFDVRIQNVGTGNNLSIKDFALKIWEKNNANGKLKFGKVPYRDGEIMRYVPILSQVEILKSFN